MWIARASVEGLVDAPSELPGWDRLVRLPAGPAGRAIADALILFTAALDPSRTADLLGPSSLGLASGTPEVHLEGPLPTEVQGLDPERVARRLVAPDRPVLVTLDLSLDPPAFGRLRELARRDHRLVGALGGSPVVSIRAGWSFGRTLEGATLGVTGLSIGDATFSTMGAERPPWLSGFLADVGTRLARSGWDEPASSAAKALFEAGLSGDPERRDRAVRATAALASPPHALGPFAMVRRGRALEPCFGEDLVPASRVGPRAADALRLVRAVLLDQPDILLVEHPGFGHTDTDAVLAWLDEHVDGDDATLEQVILLGAPS